MKSSPIIMSGESVRAILAGRKTQTRRVLRAGLRDDIASALENRSEGGSWAFDKHGFGGWSIDYPGGGHYAIPIPQRCPFGNAGSDLWVRETWRPTGWDHHSSDGEPQSSDCALIYRADGTEFSKSMPLDYLEKWTAKVDEDESWWDPWRSPIFMPQWASRLELEVVSVGVERLQDITTEDCIAEGLSTKLREYDAEVALRAQYKGGWDVLNGRRKVHDADGNPFWTDAFDWAHNPWIWRFEFRPVPG